MSVPGQRSFRDVAPALLSSVALTQRSGTGEARPGLQAGIWVARGLLGGSITLADPVPRVCVCLGCLSLLFQVLLGAPTGQGSSHRGGPLPPVKAAPTGEGRSHRRATPTGAPPTGEGRSHRGRPLPAARAAPRPVLRACAHRASPAGPGLLGPAMTEQHRHPPYTILLESLPACRRGRTCSGSSLVNSASHSSVPPGSAAGLLLSHSRCQRALSVLATLQALGTGKVSPGPTLKDSTGH